jgi:hypothetical protein
MRNKKPYNGHYMLIAPAYLKMGGEFSVSGSIEWQWTLVDLKKAMDIIYQDVLNKFDST